MDVCLLHRAREARVAERVRDRLGDVVDPCVELALGRAREIRVLLVADQRARLHLLLAAVVGDRDRRDAQRNHGDGREQRVALPAAHVSPS